MNIAKITSVLKNICLPLLCFTVTVGVVQSQENYQPPVDRLASQAARSSELYVEPHFNFETHKVMTLDILALDDNDNPLSKHKVFIYGRPASVDNENAASTLEINPYSLLGILLTDESGVVYSNMDIGVDIVDIRLILQAVGVESSIDIDLRQSLNVNHVFR